MSLPTFRGVTIRQSLFTIHSSLFTVFPTFRHFSLYSRRDFYYTYSKG
jgi:hypothetical protein